MAKQFEDVKKELDQELAAIYNREENARKHERMAELTKLNEEIDQQKSLYDSAVENEDYDTAAKIKENIRTSTDKKNILQEIVNNLSGSVPDYTHDEIVGICRKESEYFKQYAIEKLKDYLSVLEKAQKLYEEILEAEFKYTDYQTKVSHKSPLCPEWPLHMFFHIPDYSSNLHDFKYDLIDVKNMLNRI